MTTPTLVRGTIYDKTTEQNIHDNQATISTFIEDQQAKILDSLKFIHELHDKTKNCNLSLPQVREAYVKKCKSFCAQILTHYGFDKISMEALVPLIFKKVLQNNAFEGHNFNLQSKIFTEIKAQQDTNDKIMGTVLAIFTYVAFRAYINEVRPVDILIATVATFVVPILIVNINVNNRKINDLEKELERTYSQWMVEINNVNRDVKQADVETDCAGLRILNEALSL